MIPISSIQHVKKTFPLLSDREKYETFANLSRIRKPDGAIAIMELLDQYADSGTLPEYVLLAVSIFPEHVNIYFPKLLNYIAIPKFGHSIFSSCSYCLSCKWLSPNTLESHFAVLISHYESLKARWKQEAIDPDTYNQLYFLIEILGYFPKPVVEQESYDALKIYESVGLKYQAINALWRLGKHVDSRYVVELIADDSMRWSMFWRLQERSELSLFPEQFRTAESFARATLVSRFQDMYGAKLDKVEFVEVLSVTSKHADNSGDYYAYRVLTDFGQDLDFEKDWVSGWAGPAPSDFDYMNMRQPQTIFSRTGISDDLWGSVSPQELILSHLRRFYKENTE